MAEEGRLKKISDNGFRITMTVEYQNAGEVLETSKRIELRVDATNGNVVESNPPQFAFGWIELDPYTQALKVGSDRVAVRGVAGELRVYQKKSDTTKLDMRGVTEKHLVRGAYDGPFRELVYELVENLA